MLQDNIDANDPIVDPVVHDSIDNNLIPFDESFRNLLVAYMMLDD